MQVVDAWTGQHAGALQRAMRLTNEGFAGCVGTAVRTVAKWSAKPEMVLTPELQRALDTLLRQASDDVKARFDLLIAPDAGGPASPEPHPALARLASDRRVSEALAWSGGAAGWPPGAAHDALIDAVHRTDPQRIQTRGLARQRISQQEIASALSRYYATSDESGFRP